MQNTFYRDCSLFVKAFSYCVANNNKLFIKCKSLITYILHYYIPAYKESQ